MYQDRIFEMLTDFGLTDISFGSQGFRIFLPEEILEGQLGYSMHPDGTDLTDANDGDWKKEWIVIGRDVSIGEPYFVDSCCANLPVFTAMHGRGSWEPDQISNSLYNFLNCLKHLRSVSPQWSVRVSPDETTMTNNDEIAELELKLTELNGEGCFWAGFVNEHKSWIQEND